MKITVLFAKKNLDLSDLFDLIFEKDLKNEIKEVCRKVQDINIIKEDIQEAINQDTIQKRRDSKINQILGDEQTTIPNNMINLTIDIQNSMLD